MTPNLHRIEPRRVRRIIVIATLAVMVLAYVGVLFLSPADPLQSLTGLKAAELPAKGQLRSDGSGYETRTLYFVGNNALLSRQQLKQSLARGRWHIRATGSNYDFYTDSTAPGGNEICWLETDFTYKMAVIHEYRPISALRAHVLKILGANEISVSGSSELQSLGFGDADSELISSCLSGDVSKAKSAISMGADVSGHTASGIPPLYVAMSHDNLQVAQILLAHGADWNSLVFGKGNVLETLADCGHPDAVEFAFRRGARFSDSGARALVNCGIQSSPVDLLLNTVRDLSGKGHETFAEGGWIDDSGWKQAAMTASVYIRHGAKINDRAEMRPMTLGQVAGKWVVKLSPDKGQTRSALETAVDSGNAGLVQLLVNNGADASDFGNRGSHSPRGSFRNDWRRVEEMLAGADQRASESKTRSHPGPP